MYTVQEPLSPSPCPHVQSDSNEKARFVATQGALPATVTDFWRMVFQEGTGLIVMTTNETERGRVSLLVFTFDLASWPTLPHPSPLPHPPPLPSSPLQVKCHCYWPQEQCEQTYGRITVKNLAEYAYPHYVLREFLVHRAPGPEEQVIEETLLCVCVCVLWAANASESGPVTAD